MLPVIPVETIIAERLMTADSGEPVRVAIGLPAEIQGHDWACPFLVSGLGKPISGCAYGIDALQALQQVTPAIRHSIESRGVNLKWIKMDFWQAGFPKQMDSDSDPEFERVLVAKLREEHAKRTESKRLRRLPQGGA